MTTSTTISNSTPTEPLWHSAFYKFAQLDNPDAVVDRLRELTAPLTGSVLVATEGINGMVAGSTALLDAFEHALQHDDAFGGKFPISWSLGIILGTIALFMLLSVLFPEKKKANSG